MLLHSLLTFILASASLVSAWNTYVVPHTLAQDDTPALLSALAHSSIVSNTTILFQSGVTYNIWTPIKFPTLKNVEVSIQGNLTYPNDIATVQGMWLLSTENAELICVSIAGVTSSVSYINLARYTCLIDVVIVLWWCLVCFSEVFVDIQAAEIKKRFTFTGGTNVTLTGSTDPKWGWVDGHGQAVSFPSITLRRCSR